jgi:CheY-like chemotaxis protein
MEFWPTFLMTPTPDSPPAAPPLRVLVVDDNADGAATLSMLFELSGHQVSTAGDGQSALSAAAEFRPHVVLLDIGLPVLDGYEVAARLRADPAFTGIILIALTGYGQDADRERCQQAGFDHYFVKPTDPRVLCDVLSGCAATLFSPDACRG